MSSKYSFGLHSLLLSNTFGKDDISIFKKARDLGFDGIEIIPVNIDELPKKEIIKEKERLNMGVNLGVSLNKKQNLVSSNPNTRRKGRKFLKKIIDIGNDIGAENLVGIIYSAIGYTSDIKKRKEKWRLAIDEFRKIAEYASNNSDLNLCIEPSNRYETNIINTVEEGNKFIKEIGLDNVKLNLDTYHMIREESNIKKSVLKSSNNLGYVHVSSNNRGIIGDDPFPWKDFFYALNKINYNGWITIEGIDFRFKNIANFCKVWRDVGRGKKIAEKGLSFLRDLEESLF